MTAIVAAFAAIMGLAIGGIRTRDILLNPAIDLSQGFFRARE